MKIVLMGRLSLAKVNATGMVAFTLARDMLVQVYDRQIRLEKNMV